MVTENTSTGGSPVERGVSLRPCPFCGNDDLSVSGTQLNYVRCDVCGVEIDALLESDAEVALRWNRRIDASLVQAARELAQKWRDAPEGPDSESATKYQCAIELEQLLEQANA